MLLRWLRNRQTKCARRRKTRKSFQPTFESLDRRELLAANVFVSPAGSDTAGAGTFQAPYATIGKALTVAQAGDTVTLRGGEYRESVRVRVPNLTIRAHENEWPKIIAPVDDEEVEVAIRFDANARGGRLQHLDIQGGFFYGVMMFGWWSQNPAERACASGVIIEDSRIHDTGRDAIKITPGCDDVIIRRNEIFNTGLSVPADEDEPNADGIDNVNGDRMIVQDNYIHDIRTNGLYAKGGSVGSVIEGNLVTNTGGIGIAVGFYTDEEWFDHAANPDFYENIDGVVRNNIVMNTANAGIGLYAAKNPSVYNNTLIDVAQASQGGIGLSTSEIWISDDLTLSVPNRDVKIANNIVKLSSLSDRPAFEIRAGALVGSLLTKSNRYFHQGTAATFRDRRAGNEFSGGFAGWRTHVAGEVGSAEGDPRLDSNQHLLPNSPCIDAGTSQFSPVIDYDGLTRSGPIDIGADEANGPALQVPPPEGTVGKGKIDLNAPVVGFSVGSSLGAESVASVQLTVTLSKASTQTVTVAYAISGGTALSGSDYQLTAGTLSFAPGQTSAAIPVTVTNDTLDENDETLIVTLSNPVKASLGNRTSHTYVIQDNDAMPTVQFTMVRSNWNESIGSGSIALRLSAPSGRPVTVNYRVSGGTASLGPDYTLNNGSITFQPGQINRVIPVSIVNDTRDENNETLVVSLLAPTYATLGTQKNHTVTIVDNDPIPTVSFRRATTSVNEMAGSTQVYVALSAASAKTVRVNYAVVPGSATDGGVDYTLNSGTITFQPGEIAKPISVSIVDDALAELDEQFTIRLSSPVNGTLGATTDHRVTILDNDTIPTGQSFITFRLANGRIYRIAPQAGASPVDMSSALNNLSPGTEDDNLNTSPDGKWLALTTDRFGIGSDWTGLAVVAADLSSGEAVKVNGEFVHPDGPVAVASGGNLVIFSASGGPHVRDLWAVKKNNGVWTMHLLTATSPYEYNAQPAISADGNKVLFEAGPEPYGDAAVAIGEVRTDGTGFRVVVSHAQRPVGTSPENLHHADYAPDGSIIFETGWTGDQIWRLAPGSTTPVRVSNATNEVSPCVLADGRIVTLWLNRPGNSNGVHELTVRKSDGTYLFTLLAETDVQDIGISCGG